MPIRTFDMSQPVDAYYAAKERNRVKGLQEYQMQRQKIADERADLEFQRKEEARPLEMQRKAQQRAVETDEELADFARSQLTYLDPDAPDFQEQTFKAMDAYTRRMKELGYDDRAIQANAERIFKSGALTPEGIRALQEKEGIRRKPEGTSDALIVGLLDKYYADPASLSSREKAILKSKGKLPSQSIGEAIGEGLSDLGAAIAPTTSTKTAIQKDLVNTEKALLGINAIEDRLDKLPDEAFEVMPRAWSEAKDVAQKLGMRDMTAEEKKFRSKLTDFAVATGRNFDSYRQQITGAQAGMRELQMLQKRVPISDGVFDFDSKVDAKAKIRANKEFFEATSKRLKDILSSGFTILDNKDGEFYGMDKQGNLVDLTEEFPIVETETGFEYAGDAEAKKPRRRFNRETGQFEEVT